MEEIYHELENAVQYLIDSGLLDALGDNASEVIEQYALHFVMLIGSFLAELVAESALLLVLVLFVLALLAVIVVGALIISAVLLILAIISYVFRSIGLMRIAKKLGVKYRFLAWIPFASAYLVGACAEKSLERDGKKPWKWGTILLLTLIATTVGMPFLQLTVSVVLSVLPLLAFALDAVLSCASLIYLGLYTYCLFCVFKQFSGTSGGLIFAICTLFMHLIEGIFVFIVSCLHLREPATKGNEPEKDARSESAAESAAGEVVLPVEVISKEQE